MIAVIDDHRDAYGVAAGPALGAGFHLRRDLAGQRPRRSTSMPVLTVIALAWSCLVTTSNSA
jgi:hypothetical protein